MQECLLNIDSILRVKVVGADEHELYCHIISKETDSLVYDYLER